MTLKYEKHFWKDYIQNNCSTKTTRNKRLNNTVFINYKNRGIKQTRGKSFIFLYIRKPPYIINKSNNILEERG